MKSEDDLKKQAEKHFEDEDYNLAYKHFAQLVSLYPKDPEYNYKLGVCMLYTEPDKKKPFSYLQIATKNPTDAPKDALFYLAKTYHINYRFDEAIKLYTDYKKTASSSSIKKLQVDREIQACKNGKRLLSNLTDLVVMSKKQLNEADYYRGYDVKDIGGKLLVKPDDYKTPYDKKKKDKSVVYLSRKAERLYYSSYGESGNTGRDIYFVNKLPNGTWSKPTMLPATINTEFDEDYPFLHPNGKTLYFSSKGFNSMGGYDVFKTTYDETTQTWSKPENLEFPINSPDDDILFVTDSLEKTAFFSTGRYSPYGKLDVLKINTERRPMNSAVVKGSVVKEEASQSVKSKISVKNMENGEIVGVFLALDNGDYNLELPNGGKFLFTVETPGIATQSDAVQIPVAYTLKPYKQLISYDNKILKIINYFDGEVTDENYSMMIDFIEKKAKLEVNETEPYNNSLLKDGQKNQNATSEKQPLNSVSTTNPTVQSEDNTTKNVTNEQLLDIAKSDAQEASNEAAKLKQEAQDAFGLATQMTAESVEKQKAADEALANANLISDVVKKNEELTKANQLKEEAKIATNVANTATNLAKKLEVDASIQQKEAELTNQYIKQLEAVIKNKNNKESLAKLAEIQKELDAISQEKNQSNELLNSLKAEASLKQQELTNSEKKSAGIQNEINAIRTEAENLEKDLANESDKAIKENISAQIRELNSEVELKNKDLATNNQKIENLKNEVAGLNQELNIASKILNESSGELTTNTSNTSTTEPVSNGTQQQPESSNTPNPFDKSSTAFNDLKNKFDSELNNAAINKTHPESITKENDILNSYNNEVDEQMNSVKAQISKTSDSDAKKKLNQLVIQLENQKNQNNARIASNNSTLNELNGANVAINSNSTENKSGDTQSNNNVDAITKVSETFNEIKNKYASQINTNSNKTDNASLSAQNEALNSYNNELTNLISSIENQASQTTDQQIKESFNKEVSKIQALVTENNKLLASNTAALNETESVARNSQTESGNTNSSNPNSNANNTSSGNENASETINNTNSLAADNAPIKPISINSNSDKKAILNEIKTVKSALSENSNAAKEIFAYNSNNEKNITISKGTLSQKFETAKNNENELSKLITSAENMFSQATVQSPESILTEAENLNAKALEQRKESAGKTGSEKDDLVKLATENEKLATDKKLEAANLTLTKNKSNFENNALNLTELKKLTGDKTGNDISQANLLIDEAALNFKQAQKLRTEAENYPAGAAKLGGLENAEEKENEVLAKQQKALNILLKVNPTYKMKAVDAAPNSTEIINAINNQITKTSQSQIDAYLELSKVNQAQLANQNNQLIQNPLFKSPENKEAQNLKASADQLNSEAKTLIGQSVLAKTPTEKANLLLKANEKEIAALKSFDQATELLKSTTAVASNQESKTSNINGVTDNGSKNNGNETSATNRTTNENTNSNKDAGNQTSADQSSNNQVTTNSDNGNATTTNVTANPTENNNNNAENPNTQITANNSANAGKENTNSATELTNLATINAKGIGDEVSKIKSTLNNSAESSLTAFDAYSNNEAITLKNDAVIKINSALEEDRKISSELDNINTLSDQSEKAPLNQQTISALVSEADKLNEDASALRKSAISKSTAEKESDIANAKRMEAAAIEKKLEAANKQLQLNKAVFEANKSSLEELAVLAKGKNIGDLGTVDMQLNEATLLLKQANNLRTEANGYPNDAAKLGGFNNAEEKENEAIAKQQAILEIYKKHFPNYIPRKAEINESNPEALQKLSETKNKLNTTNQNHIEGLSLLAQANEKEFKTLLLNLPSALNSNQSVQKTNAQAAYKKQQNLVAEANQTSDPFKKKNLLIDANKSGHEAINTLNKISNPNSAQNSSTIAGNETNRSGTNQGSNANNNATTNNTANRTNSSETTNPVNNSTAANIVKIKVKGLEVKNANAYSAEKPIPIDEKIPDGLVFKVQIGAFKAPLPNTTFKGLSPVIAQTTPNGYIRYMAGNFDEYSGANAVKNDLRNLGYLDAFVVAYLNGKRINLNEALEQAKNSGQIIDPLTNTSAGLTANSNVPRNPFPAPTNNAIATTTDSQPVEITSELEKLNGLLYTVQIGVYSKQITKTQLNNLKPIYTEKLPSGLYRYTAGIYNQTGKLIEDKRKVVDLGVKDAFVSAYYNAKRISFADAQKLQAENNNLQMEKENPIIFPGSAVTSNDHNSARTNTITNPNVQAPVNNTNTANAFSNGVVSGPTPTPENGVKTDDTGISFKVQIGAYKNQVPNEVASKFLNIKTWPVQNVVINGLYIYTIGNFNAFEFAKKLKDEAVSLGINDAFITVYKDGKKLYGAESMQYLNR
ncbi:MAG: WD40-like beta Propeller containing protein [Bacteroidota bacterium]|nr:WD40-like beta Propeller containing protein [Bacteroidota bacterium]